MVRIPLIGVPKHLWKMFTGLFSASPGLILWRVFLLIALTLGTAYLIAVTGGGGVTAIVLAFALTTLLSHFLRDDILAIWRDLWNARWGEVKV
jgi:hypothetical protein